jgi:hypothetical protein
LRIIPSENNDNNVASQRDLVASVSYSLEVPATTKKRKECGWRWSLERTKALSNHTRSRNKEMRREPD